MTPQQQALRDLDKAYANIFAGRAGSLAPRKKGVNDALRFQGREIKVKRLNSKWSAARLPKIGWLKFRDTRLVRGKTMNVRVEALLAPDGSPGRPAEGARGRTASWSTIGSGGVAALPDRPMRTRRRCSKSFMS
ncbi:hypothetical protein AJ87_43795 [Rhizobium yanglingense]|nr:hypothetical protein AJ87_43795 [Rhizobium yanglingense]